jgi:delta1-piperideine-2-carboxylate reductase
MMSSEPETVRLSFAELSDLLTAVFAASGVGAAQAAILGDNSARCERDGAASHGVFRIPGYRASLASGWIDGHAIPDVEQVAPAFLRADAKNGFAQPALAAAKPQLLRSVETCGAAVLAIRNSHHFSALWPDLEPFAAQGLVALSAVAGLACVAPAPGARPVFGTNPIAFAAPAAGAAPLVFDLSTSACSNGDLRIAAREGRPLPAGAGVDRDGYPTTDPDAVLDGGALLPFGGYKGAALSLMVEVLAAALTGGQFSHEVDFSAHPGAETPCTGQLIILIDPGRAGGAAAERVAGLLTVLRAAGAERLPGDHRYAQRRRADREGIALSSAQWRELDTWATAASPLPKPVSLP